MSSLRNVREGFIPFPSSDNSVGMHGDGFVSNDSIFPHDGSPSSVDNDLMSLVDKLRNRIDDSLTPALKDRLDGCIVFEAGQVDFVTSCTE